MNTKLLLFLKIKNQSLVSQRPRLTISATFVFIVLNRRNEPPRLIPLPVLFKKNAIFFWQNDFCLFTLNFKVLLWKTTTSPYKP